MTESDHLVETPSVARRTKRRRTFVAVVIVGAVVAIAAVAAVVVVPLVRGSGEGPLASDSRVSYGAKPVPGQVAIWNITTFTNDGRAAAVIDDVELVGKSPNLAVEGVLVGILTGDACCGLAVSWPPTERSARGYAPPEGFRVPGGASAQLLVGTRIPDGELGEIQSLTVRYHVGWRRYTAHYAYSYFVCSALAEPVACDAQSKDRP